jgi:cell wall-associated NlpC family hydrolase
MDPTESECCDLRSREAGAEGPLEADAFDQAHGCDYSDEIAVVSPSSESADWCQYQYDFVRDCKKETVRVALPLGRATVYPMIAISHISLLSLAFGLCLPACASLPEISDQSNEQNLFSSFAAGGKTMPTTLTLKRAGGLKATIETASMKMTAGAWETADVWFGRPLPWESLRIRFPKLTDAQFDMLSATYGRFSRAKSKVKRPSEQEASFEYQLSDFLPPIVQATNERGFSSERLPGPVTVIRTNCWTTALSIFRQAENPARPFVAYYDDAEMKTVQDAQYSDLIRAGSVDDLRTPTAEILELRSKTLQPGDLVVFGRASSPNDTYVNHVAIFIDDEIFFEKTGPTAASLYRFISWEKIVADPIHKTFQFRRFGRSPLPDAVATVSRRTVSLEVDAVTGRTQISASNLLPLNPK